MRSQNLSVILPNSAVAMPKGGACFSLSQREQRQRLWRVREKAGPAKMATVFLEQFKTDFTKIKRAAIAGRP
jgi:hypothetical protein